MGETPADSWEDVIETVRSDLEVIRQDDADAEDVSAAVEEMWAIVDAFETRVGSVDTERLGSALGVDFDVEEGPIDVSSIPTWFVEDNLDGAAKLGRLVSLIALDDATDFDVGRLWGDDPHGPNGIDDESASLPSDSSWKSADSDSTETDDFAEEIRSELADSLSELRDVIYAAREGFVESSRSEGDSSDDESVDSNGSPSPSVGLSRSSERRSTVLSTVPSSRSDMGGVTHHSTVPARE